jgi:tripartite-type tricarboxylate transporter receptor subunit TctC
MVFATAATAIPQIKAGKIRGLAVTTATRAGMLPDLPTIAEAALPGFRLLFALRRKAPSHSSRNAVVPIQIPHGLKAELRAS